jgi:hypothetical protein
MFWCHGVHCCRHVTYRRMCRLRSIRSTSAQIWCYRTEIESVNSVVAARLHAERCSQRRHTNRRTSVSLERWYTTELQERRCGRTYSACRKAITWCLSTPYSSANGAEGVARSAIASVPCSRPATAARLWASKNVLGIITAADYSFCNLPQPRVADGWSMLHTVRDW